MVLPIGSITGADSYEQVLSLDDVGESAQSSRHLKQKTLLRGGSSQERFSYTGSLKPEAFRGEPGSVTYPSEPAATA